MEENKPLIDINVLLYSYVLKIKHLRNGRKQTFVVIIFHLSTGVNRFECLHFSKWKFFSRTENVS